MTLRASCTWGDGPDVLLVLEDDGEGDALMAYEDPYFPKPPKGGAAHGYIRKGSMCLTATNAEALGHQLINSAKQAWELNKEYAKHMENRRDEEKKKMIEWKNVPPGKPVDITKERKEALTESQWRNTPVEDLVCHDCPPETRAGCKYVDDPINKEECVICK